MSSKLEEVSLGDSSSGQEEIEEAPDSVSTVMNIPELRGMIVGYVILSEYDSEDMRKKDIQALRLVSKLWLASVESMLRKGGVAMIHFDLNSYDEDSALIKQSAKRLKRFVKTFGASSTFTEQEHEDSIQLSAPNDKNLLTYSLDICAQYFQGKKFRGLEKCLVECLEGLVELKIELLKNNTPPSTMPMLNFPALKKLSIYAGSVWDLEFPSHGGSGTDKAAWKTNTRILVKTLLEASSSLNELTFWNSVKLRTFGLHEIFLPCKLTTLSISACGRKDIKILSKNRLPNLKVFNLEIKGAPVIADVFYTMLSNWSKTLKKLSLRFYPDPEMHVHVHLRFPVMEQLERLNFYGHYWDLDQGDISLQTCLPKVSSICISATGDNLRLWCMNSVFSFVKFLTLHRHKRSVSNVKPIKLKYVQLTAESFPNVSVLDITILGSKKRVMQFIFKEMLQLRILRLDIEGTESIENSTFWDALLTGLTPETVGKLKESWNDPNCAEIIGNSSAPSIKSLRRLQALTLNDKTERFEDAELLISEVSFIHAFLNCPFLLFSALEEDLRYPKKWKICLNPKWNHLPYVLTAGYKTN